MCEDHELEFAAALAKLRAARNREIATAANKVLMDSHDQAICTALEHGSPMAYHVVRAAHLAKELESLVTHLCPDLAPFVGRPSPWPPRPSTD